MDTVRRELSTLIFQELDHERAAEAALADPNVEHVVVEAPKSRRGGKRRGAGRKKTGIRRGGPHRRRPDLSPSHPVHVTLLAKEIVILEGLDLREIPPGDYELICMPLKYIGAGGDGAPARTMLRQKHDR